MDLKKFFIVLAILPILVVLAISAVSATDSINITLTSFNNGTIYSNTNATTHTINFTIVNTTSFNGYNLSLRIDGNHSVLCYGNGTGGYAHSTVGANCSSALVSGTTFTVNVNLTEGVHVVRLNVSQFGTGNANNATTGDLGAGSNDSFVITNFDSLAFGSSVYANNSNISSTILPVNITFNTRMIRNITFSLYNYTSQIPSLVGQANISYNRSFGSETVLTNNATYANFSWITLPNNWYRVQVTLDGNVTALGTNKTIDRTIILDTVIPTASSITCTGWKSTTSATVEKSATFTCTCSGTDSNSTGLTYTYDPSSTPTTATLGDKSVTCNTIDSAGNAKSSSALAYRVIEVSTGDSGGSGGGGGGGSGAGAITGNTFVVTAAQFTEGFGASLETNDGFKVTFQPSGSSAVEQHTIAISAVDANSATIIIQSDPVTIKLNIGEEKQVDLDVDGTYDVYVKLNSVTNGKADVTIKQTSGAVPEGEGVVSGGTGLPEEDEGDVGGKSNIWLWIILGVILIAIIVVATVMMNKKKK